MTTTNVTPSKETLETSVSKAKALKMITTPVTHDDSHEPVVMHIDTASVMRKMFTAQNDFENESKYIRTFLHTAVLQAAKAECRRIQNVWENAITKVNKLHPTMSREACETQLLESKKNREIKSQVDIATSLLKDEFKS